jgi:hypothetical protein
MSTFCEGDGGTWGREKEIYARRRGDGNIRIGGSSVCPSVLSPPIQIFGVFVGFILLSLVAKKRSIYSEC